MFLKMMQMLNNHLQSTSRFRLLSNTENHGTHSNVIFTSAYVPKFHPKATYFKQQKTVFFQSRNYLKHELQPQIHFDKAAAHDLVYITVQRLQITQTKPFSIIAYCISSFCSYRLHLRFFFHLLGNQTMHWTENWWKLWDAPRLSQPVKGSNKTKRNTKLKEVYWFDLGGEVHLDLKPDHQDNFFV